MTHANTVIARQFCQGHVPLNSDSDWPCITCRSHAAAALHELSGQGQIFATEPSVTPLSDPKANLPGVRRRDSGDTTIAARYDVMPRTGTVRWRILETFWLNHKHCVATGIPDAAGWTDDELINHLGTSHQSTGPRRGELVAGGWLTATSHRRPTRSGSEAIVWRLTEQACDKLAQRGLRAS